SQMRSRPTRTRGASSACNGSQVQEESPCGQGCSTTRGASSTIDAVWRAELRKLCIALDWARDEIGFHNAENEGTGPGPPLATWFLTLVAPSGSPIGELLHSIKAPPTAKYQSSG